MSEKLQKVLARTGLGSRRCMESWIAAGRITINGALAKLGDRVTLDAKVEIDGKHVPLSGTDTLPCRILLYHKPIGEICTRQDPQGRPTVYENLPKITQGRWTSIGRLDINTSGLLLFTTDGELANRLMHPAFAQEREYAVRVLGEITPKMLQNLLTGVALNDGRARFIALHGMEGKGANQWYQVTVNEGRNRLVRRLWESQGLKVSRLVRIRYGDIVLPRTLRPGSFVELETRTVNQVLSKMKGVISTGDKAHF
ncbi:MAG: pseudouridine synthase [Gammaproteobacteria bacterium]